MSWSATDIANKQLCNPESKFTNAGYKAGVAKVVFDATDGKAVGTHGLGLTIPKNSYVTKAYYKVITTFTSDTDAGTIALQVAGANDLTTATAISGGSNIWDSSGVVACTPTGTMGNEISITADSEVSAVVAVEALTAGKLVLWVEWIYYGDV
jgi:hypothetical protein